MIPNYTNGAILPGYATKGMTKKQGSRLVERFVRGDYGMATPSEIAGNIAAKKNGGELIGRYFLNEERWVLWGTVGAAGAEPDVSPILILHEKEHRDGWHKWQPGEPAPQPAADHPTKVLFDTSNDPDVTIFSGNGPTRIDESNLRKQNTQIRIGRAPDGTMVLNLKTAGADYYWALDEAQRLADGLRACADGDPLPLDAGGYVFAAKGHTLVGLTDKPVKIAGYRRDSVEIDAGMSFLQRPQAAREMAGCIEQALRELTA
jgi:hypothetical protein